MKYLKRFNEELQPYTYRKAADKLTKMGHVRRGSELTKWADETQIKLDKQREIENYNRLSKYPSFEMEIRKDRWNSSSKSRDFAQEPLIKGNFFIDISFEDDMFNDQYSDWLDDKSYGLNIFFTVGIFPADDETRIKLKQIEDKLSDEVYDSAYYPIWMGFKLSNPKDTKIDFPKSFIWDTRENDTLLFSNRREALKFKRLLSDCFEGKNKFGESKWSPDGIGEVVKKRFTLTEDQQIERFSWIHKNDTPEDIQEKRRKSIERIGDNFLTIDNYNELVSVIKSISINKLYRH